METLKGGRVNKIFKEGHAVIRPRQPWTKDVHNYLLFCHEQGMDNIPKPLLLTEKEEHVTFVSGEVFHELPEQMMTQPLITSAGQLLKKLHETGAGYIEKLIGDESWMLAETAPVQTMCHGDFAPYNVTIINGTASGIIDFDTMHPGNRLWDVAYAVYRWTGLDKVEKPELAQLILRMKWFVDGYGVTVTETQYLIPMMIKRLEALIAYMEKEAASGNADIQKNIAEGHLAHYKNDIEFLQHWGFGHEN